MVDKKRYQWSRGKSPEKCMVKAVERASLLANNDGGQARPRVHSMVCPSVRLDVVLLCRRLVVAWRQVQFRHY